MEMFSAPIAEEIHFIPLLLEGENEREPKLEESHAFKKIFGRNVGCGITKEEYLDTSESYYWTELLLLQC